MRRVGVSVARRCCSRAAFGLLRFRRFFSCAAFGLLRRKRFGVAASTCGRNDRGAGDLTSAEQIAAPDRKKRHSIRLATASLVAPLFAAGELVVRRLRAACWKRKIVNRHN